MDLFCCEAQVDFECRAYADPVLLKDSRVLDNLLNSEERHVPSASYFDCVQPDLKPHMRKIVTEWMLEVTSSTAVKESINPSSLRSNIQFDGSLPFAPVANPSIEMFKFKWEFSICRCVAVQVDFRPSIELDYRFVISVCLILLTRCFPSVSRVFFLSLSRASKRGTKATKKKLNESVKVGIRITTERRGEEGGHSILESNQLHSTSTAKPNH